MIFCPLRCFFSGWGNLTDSPSPVCPPLFLQFHPSPPFAASCHHVQIIPASSRVEVLKTKIEIGMVKADTLQWVSRETH